MVVEEQTHSFLLRRFDLYLWMSAPPASPWCSDAFFGVFLLSIPRAGQH